MFAALRYMDQFNSSMPKIPTAMSSSVLPTQLVLGALLLGARAAHAQVDYRNIDSGRPVRISDATPTARKSLELNLGNGRVQQLSQGRYRLQLEPRATYGLLPRTEVSVRAPIFFNERALRPRAGVAGVGVGLEHQLRIESLHLPSLGIGTELFVPTGPAALPPTYSVRGMMTRSFPVGRIHFNGAYGNFNVRTPVGFEKILPPIHGACSVAPTELAMTVRFACVPSSTLSAAAPGATLTHDRWLFGMAVDKSLPLRSTLLMADVFGQKYRSIGRPIDWTGEIGIRTQISRTIVFDAALGRLFTGESRATFLTFGTTISRALTL